MRIRVLFAALIVAAFAACAVAAPAGARTVWLCFPGKKPDPCTPGLSTTVYSPTLTKLRVEHPKAVKKPKIDCFYVYPTVSDQTTGNSNLHVDPEEKSIALYQVGRYSQYCRVFAPMYRQVTLDGIGLGTPTTKPNPALALDDVEAAFHTYLTRYNHGRGFVVIGHSQGSFVLESLIAKAVDPKPAVRRRLVSAILMGGNVRVKTGTGVGGSFKHISACRAKNQLGCVIAFSTFDTTVPSPSLFGRTTVPGESVLCTNPAALAGGSALVAPIFPSAPFDPQSTLAVGIKLLGLTQPTPNTVWSTEPGAYRAACSSAGGANVLQITAQDGAQTAKPSPTPEWGLHLLDANVALGNLIAIMKSEAAAFTKSGR